MKRKLITTTALLLGLFAVTLPARADRLGFHFGVAGGDGYFRVGFNGGKGHKHKKKYHRKSHRNDHHSKYDRHRHRGPNRYSRRGSFGRPFRQYVRHASRPTVHTCVRTPVYKDVWVEPVYRKAYDGRDACGRPRYVSVMVKPGYYRTYLSHYVCSCGKTYR